MSNKNIWRYMGGKLLLCIGLVILIMGNLILSSLEESRALRVDLTKNDIYTLSEESCRVLDTLQEEIYLYVVYSPGNEDVRVRELAAEYGAYSPYVQVTMVSPEVLKTTEGLIKVDPIENGIIISDGNHEVTKVYTAEELYVENAFNGTNEFRAEAKITTTIEGIQDGAFCNVYMLTGHGETPVSELRDFRHMLDMANFQVSEFDVSATKQPLNPETDILIAVSPKADLEQSEYEAIAQFMQSGGRLLLFMDKASFNTAQGILQVYTAEMPMFEKLLAEYNIAINRDIILARDENTINLRRTSFGATPTMKDIPSSLYGEEMNVVVHEAASLRFLRGGQATVTELLTADTRCFAKPLRQKIENFHFEKGDRSGGFCVGAMSEKETSCLAVITDSQCIGDTAFSIDGNYLFFDGLVHSLAPLEPPTAVSGKFIQTPYFAQSGGILSMLLIFGCLTAAPIAVVYMGMRIRSRKKRK